MIPVLVAAEKYKRCHLGKEIPSARSYLPKEPHFEGTTLYDKNFVLLAGIVDIFKLNEKKDWHDVKSSISRDHVRELYKLIADLWPPNTDIAAIYPKPENKLRSFYVGHMRPESVTKSILRQSLYCDEILVTNPFLNPWTVVDKYNPLVHPEDYVADTLKWLLFFIQLAPWTENNIVTFIPDPGDFDYQLRRATWSMAQERAKNFSLEDIKNDSMLEEYSKNDFKRMWLAVPQEAMRSRLKEHYPEMPEKEVQKMLQHVEKLKDRDPLIPTNPNEKGMQGMHRHESGANLEMAMFISQLTGSYLYTDIQLRMKEIMGAEKNKLFSRNPWTPISQSFQELDFKFLNNVDPGFALAMRNDGRLNSMRNFLRNTWGDVTQADRENIKEHTLHFSDRLKEEFGKAETEWKKIDADLAKWTLSSSGVGAILQGSMDWRIPAMGFVISAVGKLLDARFQRERFRKNVPMSVFVDLKRK